MNARYQQNHKLWALVTRRFYFAMVADDSEQYLQALSIAHQFSQQAKRRMNRSLRAMLLNEDESAKSLATYICEFEGYPWDTI